MTDIRLVKTNNSIVVNGILETNTLDTTDLNLTGDIYIASNQSYMPVGCVSIYSGSNAPDGWLFCDGQAVSRTTYSNLFNIIGTTYGSGDGDNTFNLPNMQERLPLGKTSTSNLGNVGGNNEITLNVNQIPSHQHTGTTNSAGGHTHTGTTTENGLHSHGSNATGGGANGAVGLAFINGDFTAGSIDNTNGELNLGSTQSLSIYNDGSHSHSLNIVSNGTHTHTFTTNATGGGETINIQNKYIVMNYIIRY